MKILRIFSFVFSGACVLFSYQQSFAASSSQSCTMCEYIFNDATELYRENILITWEQFDMAMDTRCSQMTALLMSQCKNMMQQYGYMMYELVTSDFSPNEGCIQLGLCDSGEPCTCTPSSSSTNITGGKRNTTTYSGCSTCPATQYSCSCNTDYAVQNQGTSSCSCSVYCSAGKYYNNGACTVCASGMYKGSAGNTSCTTCPSSGKTSGTAATSHDSITKCYLDTGSDGTGSYGFDPVCYYTE